MGALLGLLLAAVVLGLAVAYWYISVPLLAAGFAWMVVKRRDASQRAAIVAATAAATPPTPNRIAGPVWWQHGTLELTSDQLVVTLVGTTGRVLRPVPFRRATALPVARLLRVEKTTTAEGENLTFRFKGGAVHGYQGCGGGEAIIRLLEALATRVAVVENGLRWPAPRVVHRQAAVAVARVAPVALRCPACGAPAPQGTARCIYCRAALAHG
jgi:hypothetical protein